MCSVCHGYWASEVCVWRTHYCCFYLVQVNVEFVPILLGALFKEIGTAMVRLPFVCRDAHLYTSIPSHLSVYIVPLPCCSLSPPPPPQVPAVTMSSQKQAYYQKDMQDWCQYAGVELRFPDTFPLRTVLPLRVTLASKCDPALIRTLCKPLSLSLSVSLPFPLPLPLSLPCLLPLPLSLPCLLLLPFSLSLFLVFTRLYCVLSLLQTWLHGEITRT